MFKIFPRCLYLNLKRRNFAHLRLQAFLTMSNIPIDVHNDVVMINAILMF